jgi:hypothetical protein
MAVETTPTRKLGSIKTVAKKAAPAPAPKTKAKKVAPAAAPAVEAKAAKTPAAPRERKTEGPRGARGMVGVTSGLSIAAFQNELMRKNFRAKLTDAQLAEAMRVEFPSAIAYTEKHVAGIRSGYNTGARGNEKPDTPLPRFGEDGKPVTARGKAPKEPKAEKAEKAPKAKVTTKTKKG